MDAVAANRIYSAYSKFYDFLFGRFFRPKIRELIRQLGIRPGDRVLELGFGTGMSLAYYPPGCEVVGVDICRPMLDEAAKKVAAFPHLRVHMVEMDATRLAFGDNTFDHVIGAFMSTVVEDPYQLIGEMMRTCKPGGSMGLVNHFLSERPVIRQLVLASNPVFTRMGWRTDLGVSDLVENTDMRIIRSYKTSVFDLFRFVFFSHALPASRATPQIVPFAAELATTSH